MTHTHSGYGGFKGGDPRRFVPDEPSDEWNEACARWDAAEKAGTILDAEPSAHRQEQGRLLELRGYGYGAYEMECDDPSCEADTYRPEPEDPDDPHAAFARWWIDEGRMQEAMSTDPEDMARTAFIAGFRAKQDLDERGPF